MRRDVIEVPPVRGGRCWVDEALVRKVSEVRKEIEERAFVRLHLPFPEDVPLAPKVQ